MSKRTKLFTFISSTFLVVTALPLSSCGLIKTKESVKTYKKSYRMNEIKIAEQNTFRKLNNVTFPQAENPLQSTMSDEEKQAYSEFSDKTYRALVKTSKTDNFSYANLGLYSLLSEMVGASSRADLTEDLNELLGLTETNRFSFYRKMMQANSFANEDSTTQLKNGAFFNNFFGYNQNFVNFLTDLYCEAYQLNFKTDADKMVEWVNKAVNSDGFVDTNFLELTEDSELYLFSTLYFKHMWADKYLAENNVEDDFYLSN